MQAGEHTLVLHGELDLSSAPLLTATVRPICAEPATRSLVLDLSGLTFMDSTGIHALLLTKQLCDEKGFQFFLVPGEAQAHRVLQITGCSTGIRSEVCTAATTATRPLPRSERDRP